MEQNNKTNEQLHEEFELALQNLSEKLYALLHYGSYALEYLNRDWQTHVVRSAHMKVGKHRLILQATDWDKEDPKGTEVTINLPDNPVTEDMLAQWDKQTIQRDIDYHQRQLEALLERKKELAKPTQE